MKIAPGIDCCRVAVAELLEAVRKIGRLRHGRLIDQDRDERSAAIERVLYFNLYRIILLANSRTTALLHAGPFWTDDRDQYVRLLQRFTDAFAKVRAERNAVDIHEYRLVAIMVGQPVSDTAGNRFGILTPV